MILKAIVYKVRTRIALFKALLPSMLKNLENIAYFQSPEMYEMSGSIETCMHYISILHLVQLFIRVRLIPPVSSKLMACLANNDIYT